MRRTAQLATAIVAMVLAMVWAQPVSAAPAATASPSVTAEPSPEALALWKEVSARYVDTVVTEKGELTRVTFADVDGNRYDYMFPKAVTGGFSTDYAWTWNGWELNRNETRELAIEGANASVIYAIAAAAGCAPCVFGAVVEGYWSTLANQFYNRGHCAKIYFWLAITEYSGGNCR